MADNGVKLSLAPATHGAERRTRSIGGFTARLARIELDVEDPRHPDSLHSAAIYQVETPEAYIDPDKLLRDPSAAEPPYWLLVWLGARAIAHELLASPPPRGASVLDLGCGLGLSGVAAGLAGARVTFCDNVAACLQFARASAVANGLREYETVAADFTRDRLGLRFEVILAADIVYDPANYEPLAEFLEAHLAPGGTILLTESLRADASVFVAEMSARRFQDDKRALWVMDDGRRERTWLHRLSHADPSTGRA